MALAVSGTRLYIGGKTVPALYTYDIASGAKSGQMTLDTVTETFVPMAQPGLYSLNRRRTAGDVLYVLNAASTDPQIRFVPAGDLQ